jgi:hypothetical protein
MTDNAMTVLDLPTHGVEFVRYTDADCRECDGRVLDDDETCTECNGTGYDADALPSGGDSAGYGDFRECTPDRATHVIVRDTRYSDYGGSDYDASNYRSLLRDFPSTFVDVYGDYGTSALALPVRTVWADDDCDSDGTPYVLEVIAALADYPVYDESDHSAYVHELVAAAWDDYMGVGVTRDLRDVYAIDDDVIDAIPDAWMRSVWYALLDAELRDGNGDYPYCESATSVVIPCADDVTAALAEVIRARRSVEWVPVLLAKYPDSVEPAPDVCRCRAYGNSAHVRGTADHYWKCRYAVRTDVRAVYP